MGRTITRVLLLVLASVRIAAAEEISLLSYNTHGLHRWIARDDPEKRFPLIGERALGYDVALLQEVFLEDYYRRLNFGPETKRQAFRGNGPRPGPLGLMALCDACGSGLAAAVDEHFALVSVDRKPFGVCAGKIRGAHDCWATKGLLYLRLRTAAGAEIDLYDLHLDAGSRGADFRTRRIQIQKLREEIEARSAESAVIVAGDFNLPQDVPRDHDLVESFRQDLGLTDSVARPSSSHWTEVIDYIFYRSGPRTELTLLSAGEALEFVDEAQTPLSDHPAVFARFRVDKR